MKSLFKGVLAALTVTLALSALAAASALAAGAPTAETKPAGGITETTAALAGIVNPNEAETKYYFEYGPTTSYGSKTTEHTILTKGAASGTAKSLTAGTTYHFRLVATNSYGTSYGSDEQFTTLTAPEAVVASGKITELEVQGESKRAILEWEGRKSIECSSASFAFWFLNSKEVEGHMKWNRCKQSPTPECTNGHEVVESETLKGSLGYTNRAKKEVGVVLEGKSSKVWAKKVNCDILGTESITGKLAGRLVLPVNTKIARKAAIGLKYEEEEAKQRAGELAGQLIWGEGTEPLGFEASLTGSANLEWEVKA
jgi:hypothetical protein